MNKPVMNMVKGVAIGMAAGMAVGYMGKKVADDNPKIRKKANRAYKTFENIVDTAQYMFKQSLELRVQSLISVVTDKSGFKTKRILVLIITALYKNKKKRCHFEGNLSMTSFFDIRLTVPHALQYYKSGAKRPAIKL